MGLNLGFSFGKKKSSGKATTTTNQIVDLTGSQTQAGQQSGTTSTSTSSSGTSTTQQQGSTTQDQSQTQSGTQKTTGLTTSLGSDVISTVSDAVKSVLAGGINPENIAKLSEMIGGRTGFDSNQFVADTVNAARTRGEETLQEQVSGASNAIGGTPATNSMAALLQQRGRNDLEANLAGVRANAAATAEDIQNKNLTTAVGAQSGVANIGTALTEALKGGQTTTDMTSLTDQISNLIGKGTSASSGVTSEQQQSAQQVTQLLDTLTQLLTTQQQHTTGTEDTTQKGKSGGFGISAGI